jgi:hypothetical protein
MPDKDELLRLAEELESDAERSLSAVLYDNLAPDWRAEVAIAAAGNLRAVAALKARAHTENSNG